MLIFLLMSILFFLFEKNKIFYYLKNLKFFNITSVILKLQYILNFIKYFFNNQ